MGGRQLELGKQVREFKDSYGNIAYLDENLLISKRRNSPPHEVGYIVDDKIIIPAGNISSTGDLGISDDILREVADIAYIYDYNNIYLHPISHPYTLREVFLDISNSPMTSRTYNRLGESWFHKLKLEFVKPYMIKLGRYLAQRREVANVYPESEDMFKAFKLTPYGKVKVVIVGQDPYHTPGVADGLAFSSKDLTTIPPSLVKIFSRLEEEIGFGDFLEGNPDLSRWAEQGVFLINRTLTTEKGLPNAHREIGWKRFTDFVFNRLREHPERLVFMLWGTSAKSIKPILENTHHYILEAEHPAFAARDMRDWDNGECFKKCNNILTGLNKQIINW
jgi:uracil-DNA glycosylase